MTTVIIPVYNISNRGNQRLFWELYSLNKQPCKVFIVDGSDGSEFAENRKIINRFQGVSHYSLPCHEFNKCKLLNFGILQAKTDWVMCTDADYIFRSDFLKTCQGVRTEKRILFKEVKMLKKCNIFNNRLDKWDWGGCFQDPTSPYNPFGRKANGACQYASRGWFLNNMYDENMSGWGAMDNLTKWKAVATGLEEFWVEASEILHQYHKNLKYRTKESKDQFAKNIQIVHEYKRAHGL